MYVKIYVELLQLATKRTIARAETVTQFQQVTYFANVVTVGLSNLFFFLINGKE